MNIESAFQLFLCDKEAFCTDMTMIFYRENVPRFFDYLKKEHGLDPIECSAVTRDMVLGYIVSLRGCGLKNTSINTYFRAVKTFLNYCIDEGYCDPDVLRKVRFLKSDAETVVPLTQWEVDEIDGLYSWKCESGIRNLCIVHLMLDAGLRCAEVANLRYKDVHFDGNYITVKGKGGKVRSVLLCQRLKRMLFHYVVKFRTYAGQEDDFPFFAQLGSGDPLTVNTVKQLFARIKKGTGISRVHPHLLRHTFATSYILGGGNLEFLRLMMGHSEYETTKIYLHLAQEAKMLHVDIYRLDPVFFKSVY